MPPSPERTVRRLRAAGCVYAEDEAALLVEAAASADHLETMVVARESGRPLEQVLGWAEFRGLRILLEPGVFVPRRRTGLVVGVAAGLLRPGHVVLDLCCGAGALGAALLAEVPGLDLYAADLDPAAVRAARRNLPADRVHEGDLYDALPRRLRGRVDVIVANAPYVPTGAIALMPPEAREHEHRVALDGGGDGLALHRRVASAAPDWLAAGGHLLVETSDRQAAATTALMREAGLVAEVRSDPEVGGTVAVGRLSAAR